MKKTGRPTHVSTYCVFSRFSKIYCQISSWVSTVYWPLDLYW